MVPEVENTKLPPMLASHNDIYFLMTFITRIRFFIFLRHFNSLMYLFPQ